jgi:predicted signal transduction protein with EAL and GGDEF domain
LPEGTTVVGVVVGLAHSLGIAAIAEGLETPSQLAELCMMGCDSAQGFLFGAPEAAADIGDRPADDFRRGHADVPPEPSLPRAALALGCRVGPPAPPRRAG